MGEAFSAKHFLTWSASVEAFTFLYDANEPPTLKALLAHVAERLGNTPAVARRAYVHPAMIAAAQERGTFAATVGALRSAEHTSELPSLIRISYAVFCLKKKKQN